MRFSSHEHIDNWLSYHYFVIVRILQSCTSVSLVLILLCACYHWFDERMDICFVSCHCSEFLHWRKMTVLRNLVVRFSKFGYV